MDEQATVQQAEVTQRVEKPSKVAWLLVVVLFISNIAGFGLYGFSQRQLQAARVAKVAAEKKTADTQGLLNQANARLARATFLPKGSEVSPQCTTGNNDSTRFAPVNLTPIDGYNVYIVNCIKELAAGRTNTGKVVAFKANVDGTQKFVFGAGSGEPYCISSKILGDTIAATHISETTGLPICKTF